jgi:hypothetical protein
MGEDTGFQPALDSIAGKMVSPRPPLDGEQRLSVEDPIFGKLL